MLALRNLMASPAGGRLVVDHPSLALLGSLTWSRANRMAIEPLEAQLTGTTFRNRVESARKAPTELELVVLEAELVSAYRKAVPKAVEAVRARAKELAQQFKDGRMSPAQLARAASSELRPFAFYGPEAQEAERAVTSMAHQARSDDTLHVAHSIADWILGWQPLEEAPPVGIPSGLDPSLPGSIGLAAKLDLRLAESGLMRRPAVNADKDRLHIFMNRQRAPYGFMGMKPGIPGSVDEDLVHLERVFDGMQGELWIMENRAGQIMGSGGFAKLGEGRVELRKMYLDPSLRSRGLAARLLDYLIAKARELGYNKMELETFSAQKEGIALYQSRGFKKSDARPAHPGLDTSMYLDL